MGNYLYDGKCKFTRTGDASMKVLFLKSRFEEEVMFDPMEDVKLSMKEMRERYYTPDGRNYVTGRRDDER